MRKKKDQIITYGTCTGADGLTCLIDNDDVIYDIMKHVLHSHVTYSLYIRRNEGYVYTCSIANIGGEKWILAISLLYVVC